MDRTAKEGVRDRRGVIAALRHGFIAALLVVAASYPCLGFAQTYPSKPIRVVVQAAAGGQTDIMARVVGARLAQTLGQQVIVDNRPGAGGTIAADFVAKSPPDGYTLLTAAMNTHGAASGLYASLPYDPIRDFAPVIYGVATVHVLSVHPALPVRTLRELLALARAKPGQLNYATGGAGTSLHLFMELLKMETRTRIEAVHYKGSAPALTDVIGGQVTMVYDAMPPSWPFIKAGRLRPLAVSSAKRYAPLPDVPTTIEQGVPGFDYLSWLSFVAPAGTPRDVVSRLNTEINRILQEPDIKERLTSLGMSPIGGTPEELGAHIRQQVALWTRVIRISGARAD